MSNPPYGQPDQPAANNPNAQPMGNEPASPAPQPGGYPPQQPYPQQPSYPQPGGYPPQGPPPSQPYPPPGGYPPAQPYAQGGGYPPNYQQGGAPVLPPAQNSTAPVALIVGVLAAVVVVALLSTLVIAGKGGAGPLAALRGTPTPVPTATATPLPTTPPLPAGFSAYTATDGSYTIAYPTSWLTKNQSASGLTSEFFLSSDGQDFFLTLDSPIQFPSAEYPSLASSFAGGLKATNIVISPTSTQTTLGANTWTKYTGTMTFKGKPNKIVLLGMSRGTTSSFFLIYFAPTTTYSTVETADFTVMAKSLLFKK